MSQLNHLLKRLKVIKLKLSYKTKTDNEVINNIDLSVPLMVRKDETAPESQL